MIWGPTRLSRLLSPASILTSVLLLLCLCFQHVSTAPTRRGLPDASVTKWRSEINQGVFQGKKCVFYYAATADAKDYVRKEDNIGSKINIWDAYDTELYMNCEIDQLKQYNENSRQIEYFQHQSQVFAENCQGEVLVMIRDPEPSDEPAQSIWTDTEFLNIKDNLYGAMASGVTKVTRINVDGNNAKTIWIKPASLDIRNKNMRIMPLGGRSRSCISCVQD